MARWVEDLHQAYGPSNREAGAGRLRQASQARAASRPPGPELPLVEDLTAAPGLRVRLYRPAPRPRPLTLSLHGGGFVSGDLESHDAICRRLAQTAGVAVLAVDYRRSPEYPGPAAAEDAVTAHEWAADYRARAHLHYPGLVHGFLGLDQVSAAAAEAGREMFERFGSLVRERCAPAAVGET